MKPGLSIFGIPFSAINLTLTFHLKISQMRVNMHSAGLVSCLEHKQGYLVKNQYDLEI